MEQPDDVRFMVAEARKRTTLPLTAKIRLGIELDEQKLLDFCAMLEDEGIDMLSVHARLKKESFARTPRWEWIAKVKGRLKIPIIANGGIFSVQDAENCLRVSGADGLMIGRGAAIRPWLFAEIARDVYGCDIAPPTVSLPMVYGSFLDHLELYRLEYRLGRLKEFTHYFARNYQFGHLLASRVQSSASVDEARERAGIFFETGT
jgi:tRNA-dihydrouridine synthase